LPAAFRRITPKQCAGTDCRLNRDTPKRSRIPGACTIAAKACHKDDVLSHMWDNPAASRWTGDIREDVADAK